MSQPPDDRDDLDEALRRMEREFGPRRSPQGDEEPEAAARPTPLYGEAQPAPPQPQSVRLRLPQAAPPRASWVILTAIVLLYVASSLLSGSLVQPELPALVLLGAKVNSLIEAGELWRLIGAMFLHGSLLHIFFNGYALYALGPESEQIYGTRRFLALYFLSGIGGSVLSFLFSPNPAVGASGAIFGLMGGLGLFYYLNRRVLGATGRMQVQNIVAIGCINLLIGFAAAGTIDNFGHLGGLLAGLAAGYALAPRFGVDTRLYPPVVVRQFPPWGWGAVVGLLLLLLAAALLLPGA
jgi:rhomboid protease GluP